MSPWASNWGIGVAEARVGMATGVAVGSTTAGLGADTGIRLEDGDSPSASR
jgi:hypothetical protein